MQCAELEERIGQLLDAGRSPDDDPPVVGHAAVCAKCGALVEAYRGMLAGADALPMPELSQTFASRTVDRVFSADQRLFDTVDARRRAGRRVWLVTAATLAVAASLFVAATIWWRSPTPNDPGIGVFGKGDLATTADGTSFSVSALRPNLPPEQIRAACLSTGQSLVALPAVIRGVDTTRLSAHIRPVVRPMGAAWEAFKRTLPSGEPTAPEAGSDTGWIHAAGPYLVA